MVGRYTEIYEIAAPASAAPGSRVDVAVRITNWDASTIAIKVEAGLENAVITFPSEWANVDSGQTHSFEGYFTMPSLDDTIYAYSFWWDGNYWQPDDTKSKAIKVTELAPAISNFTIADYVKV